MEKCECMKHKMRTDEEKKALITRLNRIEGQIRGIKKMIDENAYCADILVQSSAVSSAIHSFNSKLLDFHIHSCVVDDIRSGNDNVVDELLQVLQKLMK